MAPELRHDIDGFEKKVKTLGSALAKLGGDEELKELIRIIHNPGWTTPAEFRFANVIVEAMTTHVSALTSMKAGLIQASREVKVGQGR